MYIPNPQLWRPLRLLLLVFLAVTLVLSHRYLKSRPSYILYKVLSDSEVEQSHNLIRNARGNPRYVLFKQLQGAGFNNQAQEILLFHHLALLSSRTYVYQPLVWRPRGKQAYVPLSAFLPGATKNSISVAVFDEACPTNEAMHVKLNVQHQDPWEHAKEVLSGKESCIVVDDWILNWNYLASKAIQPIWLSFQIYLYDHFEWSSHILAINERAHSELRLRSKPNATDGEPYMALHLRRGDFEEHCDILSKSHKGFTTWATLPQVENTTFAPALDSANETSVFQHCFPTLFRVLSVIDAHARARPHLRALHVLHDGAWDHPTVYLQYYKLEAALMHPGRALAAGWTGGPMTRITHSGMLPMRWGEADWAVTVDVELARNAEVFIGNGFSSLSTQVLALRLGADGGRTEDITLL